MPVGHAARDSGLSRDLGSISSRHITDFYLCRPHLRELSCLLHTPAVFFSGRVGGLRVHLRIPERDRLSPRLFCATGSAQPRSSRSAAAVESTWLKFGVFAGTCLVLYYFYRQGTILPRTDLGLYSFMEHPFAASVAAATLVHVPGLACVLPLYMVFIAAVPVMVWALLYRPAVAIASSLLLYAAAQLAPALTLYCLYPQRRPWHCNPLAWQLVFMAGLLLGCRRVRGLTWPVYSRRWIVSVCAALLILISIVQCRSSDMLAPVSLIHWLNLHLPEVLPGTGKPTVQFLRIVNLFLLVVVAGSLNSAHRLLRSRAAGAILLMGQNSLAVYSAGSVLSYFSSAVGVRMGAGRPLMLILSLGGVAMMLATAHAARWIERIRSEASHSFQMGWPGIAFQWATRASRQTSSDAGV